MSDPVAVHFPEDMRRLLLDACPNKAADFAKAQHERACWGSDDQRMLFWQEVMRLLSSPGEPQRVPAEAA